MKLLNRTIKNYSLYSALLLLLCTPLFYFFIKQLFTHEMDKVLRAHKTDFLAAQAYLKTEEDLAFLQSMNKEFILIPTDVIIEHDSLYTISLYDSATAEIIPHRVFSTGVTILGRPYELMVRESMVSNLSLIAAIMSTQIIMLTLLLIGSVLINRKLSKKVWSPFYIILDRLKRYQIDRDSTLELPVSSTAEFRDLSAAITQLVNKNHEAFLSQKEFTENAAHELQTPLAIFRTKLELLAQTKELTLEQSELVGHLLDAMDRITRLNRDLVLLSKIENRQFLETEEIDIQSVINKSIEAYRRQAQEKKLLVKCNSTEPICIRANPVLLDVLINNMISNAIRHTTENGSVVVEINKNYLTISNSGAPLQHPEKIFQRFHRESRTTLGSGLGLSIAKKVCDVSGYQIAYRYSSSMHHFTVTF